MTSKMNGRKNILVGLHFSLLWLGKLAKEMENALEGKVAFIEFYL